MGSCKFLLSMHDIWGDTRILHTRAVDFGVFLRPGPSLANFRAGPGYPKFISTDRVIILLHAPALLATASASVYVLYSTRLCYLSQLAPIWRIVHSELDTPHTSARRHEGFCIRMHILRDNIQMCAECLMPNAQSFGSELRIVHSELDTPHTFACHHEGFCIRMHILRDDMQTCA